MKLYICLSLYNVLITLIKSLLANEKIDVIIGTQTPNYADIIERLKPLECVRNVYLFESTKYKDITYKNRFDKLINHAKNENDYIESQLNINWADYKDNVYIYNDFEIMGYYLVNKKINYHLIEDGLDFFTFFHTYYHLPKSAYDVTNWKIRIKNLFGIGHRLFGTSKYATDVEVNKLEGVVINTKKVFECSRNELFSELKPEHKKIIYSVFCAQKVEVCGGAQKTALLCTQPLVMDGQLDSMDLHKRVYEDIISEYSDLGYVITIKPHPRDDFDYGQFCERYGCFVIDRYIPSQVLNFDPVVKYDLALSITTTAIESLEFVKERKYLGFERLEPYK